MKQARRVTDMEFAEGKSGNTSCFYFKSGREGSNLWARPRTCRVEMDEAREWMKGGGFVLDLGSRALWSSHCICSEVHFVLTLRDVGDCLLIGFIDVGGSQAAKLNC